MREITLRNRIRSLVTVFVVAGALLFTSFAFAASPFDGAKTEVGTVAETHAGFVVRKIEIIVGGIIQAALSLVGVIFLVYMVYGGYLWMTARGESSQIEKAKDIIKTAIIGLIITLGAYAISVFVVTKILTASGIG